MVVRTMIETSLMLLKNKPFLIFPSSLHALKLSQVLVSFSAILFPHFINDSEIFVDPSSLMLFCF